MIIDLLILAVGIVFVLAAAELFTNGIETLGHRLQVSKIYRKCFGSCRNGSS